MTLKQLEAFYWAANCATFALAAARVHISISSLSKRISELELSLGKQLFDRNGQKAVLTDAGERLLPCAKSLLQEAENISQLVKQDAGIRGICRFGVGELTALTWLPKLIASARKRYPELKLEPLVAAGSSLGSLEQKVFDGVLDFAIVAGRPVRSTIQSDYIGEAHFKWVGAPTLLGDATTISAAMLTNLPLVTLPSRAGTTGVLNDWLETSDMISPHRLACNSWGAVAGLLVEGLGVGILPVSWATPLAQRDDIRILKARQELMPLRYSFQWRSDDRRPLITGMREAVKESVNFKIPGRWLQR